MIVNNLRGIELYGSVHTSISSGEKKDNKVPFTLSEEFIGQSRIFFQTILLVNKICSSWNANSQVSYDEHGINNYSTQRFFL